MILQEDNNNQKKKIETLLTQQIVLKSLVFLGSLFLCSHRYVQAFLRKTFFKKLSRTAVILLDVGHD